MGRTQRQIAPDGADAAQQRDDVADAARIEPVQLVEIEDDALGALLLYCREHLSLESRIDPGPVLD